MGAGRSLDKKNEKLFSCNHFKKIQRLQGPVRGYQLDCNSHFLVVILEREQAMRIFQGKEVLE